MKKIKVTLVKGLIDRPEIQYKNVRALGLNKLNSSAVLVDTPQIRGIIRKINHLLKVEEIA